MVLLLLRSSLLVRQEIKQNEGPWEPGAGRASASGQGKAPIYILGCSQGSPLTQAVPRNGDPSFEERVPLQEELVEAVHFGCHRVHDGLAIGGAVVEENVQDGVVDEVTQAIDAGQRDSLQVPAGRKREARSEVPMRPPRS